MKRLFAGLLMLGGLATVLPQGVEAGRPRLPQEVTQPLRQQPLAINEYEGGCHDSYYMRGNVHIYEGRCTSNRNGSWYAWYREYTNPDLSFVLCSIEWDSSGKYSKQRCN